jgi:O-antigen/teichoic acid export membrane protein
MNSISSNIFNFSIPLLFSFGSLGFFNIAQRALGAPSAFIGSSIGQVYLQQASEEKLKTGNIIRSFDSTLKKLIILSLLTFLPLYFVIADVFAVLFGEDWLVAGLYAKILIPYFAVNFVVSALSMTDSIMEKQYIYAGFNFFMLSGLVSIVYLFEFNSIESFFVLIRNYLIIIYLIYLIVMRNVAKGRINMNLVGNNNNHKE